MSDQERKLIIAIVSTLLVSALYCLKMFELYQQGLFSGADATVLVGKSILALILANVLVNIVVAIVANIVFSLASKTCESPVSDERDKLIELKGMQVSYAVFGAGLLLSMGVLALGWASFIVFNLIILSITIGEVVGNLTKIHQYRSAY